MLRALKLEFLYPLPGVFVQNNNPAIADYIHVVIQEDCAAGRDITDRSGQAQLVILIGEDIAAIASRQEVTCPPKIGPGKMLELD